MIRLLPDTDSQIIAVVPREFPTEESNFDDVTLVITEDGTNISETIEDIVAEVTDNNSNYVYMDIAFSILREGYGYYLEFTKGGELWFRDKAFATAQVNKTVKHTLNTNEYEEYNGTGGDYIILE
jgi:hypothetical protein